MRILVVDDDAGIQRLIQKSLTRAGFEISTASSGTQAIAWLRQNHADLLLLDLKLQDMQGSEVIARLRQDGGHPPFIVITGQGDEKVAVEMMKQGALDYLVKGAEFTELLVAVVARAAADIEKDRQLQVNESERRRLEQEIIDISNREQRRIGQDLHDGLGQHLAGVELLAQVLEQNLRRKSPDEAADAAKICEHVREAIAQTRMLARGLCPVELEANGLMSALHELAGNTAKLFRIQCSFDCEKDVLVSDHAKATHLYRIAQESINNALKHGKATRVTIELVRIGQKGELVVSDNGQGFQGSPKPGSGMGLRIMSYRARMAEGELRIGATPGGGVAISCSFPLKEL